MTAAYSQNRHSHCTCHQAARGTEHSATTVRFKEAEFHWPLFGNEFEEVTVASVP
jgi:hypothetical protein